MNLAEALNAALPDLPARKVRVSYPKVDPGLIWQENTDDGKPVIVAMIRGRDSFFRFPPEQWNIIELFDGTRSWEDVAALHAELYGTRFDPDDLREFTSSLDAVNFWYRTPLEKTIALQQKLEEGRHQHAHKKSKWGDVAHMQFSAWDPDRYFNRIYPRLKWLYSRWFGVVCLVLFGFMIYVFAANWGQIAQDSLLFYNFTQKTAADLAEFWLLFLILAFFHESAHGLTCKHYGGQVHAMGFHLIYLTPAFFVDVSEAFVYAGRWQRFLIILAGIGVEMIFCAVATVVWWGTPPRKRRVRSGVQNHADHRSGRCGGQYEPAHQAGWVLRVLRDHRLLRHQGDIDSISLGAGSEAYLPPSRRDGIRTEATAIGLFSVCDSLRALQLHAFVHDPAIQ